MRKRPRLTWPLICLRIASYPTIVILVNTSRLYI